MTANQDGRRSVAGVAIENGAVFAARRKEGGDLGGKWEFPGGKARIGESDRDALVREYGEELSAAIDIGEFLGETEFIHKSTRFILSAYRVAFRKGKVTLKEHTECRWVTEQELGNLDFAPSDRALFPVLREALRREAAAP